MDSMKTLITQIKDVVPKGAKVAALIFFIAAVLCAAAFAFHAGVIDAQAHRSMGPSAAAIPLAAVALGTVGGLWLLAVGYIYADAKRRGMPPALWVAVAILVPNMIGFILYFALRKPLLSACANCGQGVMPEQKFCPSCGHEQGSNSSSNASSSGTGSISLNRQSDGLARKSFATGLSVWVGIFIAKGMFMYWKHATADAGGWLILAGICAWVVAFLQQRTVQPQSRAM
jgi:hypothetical protein